jgi:hypothetical protein
VRRPLVAGEAGLYLTGRKLTYGGAGTGSSTLRGYDASAIASPRLRLELFPAARIANRFLAGLGAFGDYSTSVGLKTQVEGTAEKRSTTFTSVEAGLLWRAPPIGFGLVLVPSASWRRDTVSVGTAIPGLPDAALTGWKGALGAEVPLGSRLALLAGAGYVSWSKKGDLVGPDFFPGGSARGLELEAGLAVTVVGPISVRALFEYRTTRYSLDPDPTGAYVATGATDAYVGGRLALRGEY